MTEPLRIAVLDDYQGIADTVDWSPIPRATEITSLREHIAPGPALVETLAGHEVVVAMREPPRWTRRCSPSCPRLETARDHRTVQRGH